MAIAKPNYTQTPNVFFDEMVKEMSEAELKVTLIVMRRTFGFHRERVGLTIAELRDATGMSIQGVTNGIEAGEARGVIVRQREGHSFYYSINVEGSEEIPASRIQDVLPSKTPTFYEVESSEKPLETFHEVESKIPRSRILTFHEVERPTPVLNKDVEIKNNKEIPETTTFVAPAAKPTGVGGGGDTESSSSLDTLPSFFVERSFDEKINQRAEKALRERGWTEQNFRDLLIVADGRNSPSGFVYSCLANGPFVPSAAQKPAPRSYAAPPPARKFHADFTRALDTDAPSHYPMQSADIDFSPPPPRLPAAAPSASVSVSDSLPPWRDVLADLQMMLEPPIYAKWVAGSLLADLQDDRAVVQLPCADAADWVANRLANNIKRSLSISLKRAIRHIDFVYSNEEQCDGTTAQALCAGSLG